MFLFNAQTLKPFDVILVRFPGNAMSENIRKKCISEYSHTIVYLGDDSFIEGNVPVVGLFSTIRYHFKDLDNVKVLRLKDTHLKNFDLSKAEEFLRGLAYCDYNLRQLSGILNRSIPGEVIDLFHREKRWTTGIVCTSLVTLPYYIGGIDISTNDEPYYAHFGYIENSHFFEEVTKEVFAEVDTTIPNNYDYLSMCETGSLLEKQSEIVHQLNTVVKGIFKDLQDDLSKYESFGLSREHLLFSNWEDVIGIIHLLFESEKGKEIDQKIYETIVSSGFDKLWFEEVHNHPQVFFPLHYLRMAVANGDPIEPLRHYEFSAKTFEKSHQRSKLNEDRVFENFTVCPSKTNHVLLDLYHCWTDLLHSTILQYKGICKEYANLLKTL